MKSRYNFWVQHKYKAIKTIFISSTLFFSATLNAGFAIANDAKLGQEGMKCSEITDRVQRLLCFDSVFKTPVQQLAKLEEMKEPERPDGPLRSMAKTLERQRINGDTGWIMRARPWQETMLLTEADYERILTSGANKQPDDENGIKHEWTPQTVDIFMTMKEADVSPDRPQADEAIMMLSCENDITTLAVLLPKPITTLQANLSLSSGTGSIFKLNWRDIENGSVVIAGRGLESIDSIKTIANYSRVQLQVNYPEGPRAFVFDMNDLKNRLKPLRTACHW